MTRPIHLLVYNSPLFAAHWSLFIPNSNNPNKGKIIHVTGDSLNGFTHGFKRNYDKRDEDRAMTIIFLCNVEGSNVVDPTGEEYVEENGAEAVVRDAMEECALSVLAPGPSLRSADSRTPKKKVGLKNCQTWMREFVVVGIERGILPPETLVELDRAPKN